MVNDTDSVIDLICVSDREEMATLAIKSTYSFPGILTWKGST